MVKRTVAQSVFESKEALKAAKLGHDDAVRELNNTPVHMLDTGNPNHPMNDGIFGYETKEFLAKQYKINH